MPHEDLGREGNLWGSQTQRQHAATSSSTCEVNTLVQLFAFGSSSSTVVICFRKSDSCIPGWDPRRLNTAFGLDKMTWRLTANPLGEVLKKKKKSIKRNLKTLVYFSFFYITLVISRVILYATMCQDLVHKVEKEHYLYYSLKKKNRHYNTVCLVPSQRCISAGWGSVNSLVLIIKGGFYKLLFHRSHHTQHQTLWGQLRLKVAGKHSHSA